VHACSAGGRQTSDLDRLSSDFTYGALGLSPVLATQVGYHEHEGRSLDEAIDDYSAAGIEQQRQFYEAIRERASGLRKDSLDPDQQADLEIIGSHAGLALLELETIQEWRRNPALYVELAGNALYTPYVLEYAPVEQRFTHIVRRLEQVPALFEQAKANLVDAPEVWNRVARGENDGNMALIDQTLREAVPASLRAEYDAAAAPALAALRDFNGYLEDALSQKTSDWRLGKEKYARKFAYALAIDESPEALLAEAEAELRRTREEMARLAAPRSVEQALEEIARQHPTPRTYVARAKETLEQATAFVRERGLLTLPPRSNLMPGHYVQFEYANDIEPVSRRPLRNVFGSHTYIEGWAFYAQVLMPSRGSSATASRCGSRC
jgi:uncharacterized protein (DUF885 family)